MNNPESSRKQNRPRSSDNRMLIGVIIIAVGGFLLLDKLDFFFFPSWLFSWPLILIVIGFLIGAKQQFNGMGWLILIFVGVYFFVRDVLPFDWDLHAYTLPVLIIMIGILILFRSAASRGRQNHDYRAGQPNPSNPYAQGNPSSSEGPSESARGDFRSTATGEDVIDMTAVFGGIKKRVFSKNFRGGDITTLFGGAEIDFTQADINGRASVDMTQFFGGTTLIVPANWAIESDLVAILGGINDKRMHVVEPGETNKVLAISGTAIFGGIEIKNY